MKSELHYLMEKIKTGDLVRVVQRNTTHRDKIALILETFEVENDWENGYPTGYRECANILMEGKFINNVDCNWFEEIDG